MSKLYLDVLYSRRPVLNYVSPAICEAVFSSTSFPSLILDALPVAPAVSGIRISFYGDGGDFILTWDTYPGAICYSVYKLNDATDPFSNYVLIAECINDPIFKPDDWEIPYTPPCQGPGCVPDCYLITAITPTGEVAFGDPICSNQQPRPPTPGGGGNCFVNSTVLANAVAGREYSVTFTPASPAAAPGWSILSGAFPPGLTLNPTTGVLSGIPLESGSFAFTIQLSKVGGFCTGTFYMTVLGCIANDNPLPSGNLLTPYEVTLVPSEPASGLIWTISGGDLPDGLILDPSSGIISGEPTAEETSIFQVRIATAGGVLVCEKQYSITVGGLHFENLVWDTPVAQRNYATIAQQIGVIEGEWEGNEIFVLNDGPANPPSTGGDIIYSIGTFTYTGAETECVINLEIETFSGGDSDLSDANVFVYQDDVLIGHADVSLFGAPGTYSIPFTVLAGVNSVILAQGVIVNPINACNIAFRATLLPA